MIVFVFLVLMADINIFSGRIAGINDLVSGEQTKESSILSIQSNFLVMLESLKLNPFFGGGLTSHRATYDYFIGSIFPDFTEGGFLGLNQNDGSSLYILLLSETGLIGFLLFLYFVFKAIIKFRNNLENKLIGFAFAISLLFVGLRFGNIATFYIMFYVLVILKEYSISEKPAIKTTQNIKNESL
jgi:O-antigen ligase